MHGGGNGFKGFIANIAAGQDFLNLAMVEAFNQGDHPGLEVLNLLPVGFDLVGQAVNALLAAAGGGRSVAINLGQPILVMAAVLGVSKNLAVELGDLVF
ncbi:hypothetical protein DSECCO2_182010 [anaerobic digester metagenome]